MPNKINLSCELHLGKDPQGRYTSGGKMVAAFSAAYNVGRKDENRPPVWLDFRAFGENAEYIVGNLTKGSVIKVLEATPALDIWESKDGEKKRWQYWIVWKLEKEEKAPELPLDGPPVDDDSIPF